MQTTSLVANKFNLNCIINDALTVDVLIGDLGIYIADFHFDLPNILTYPNILVISTKQLDIPTTMSYIQVNDIKSTLLSIQKSKIPTITPFIPTMDHLFQVEQHSKFVLGEYCIADMHNVDVDLLVDDADVVKNIFVYE